ncbi:hypothetical protein Barb6_00235 [Bacteroidales bacterium Barb6]|nr:hypothetical protein Barb6_00235 [Bacteroidales bacterium Barb6]
MRRHKTNAVEYFAGITTNHITMAIIKSAAIGAGKKSLGNLTYRHVRGRTIASERITSNNSRTPRQVMYRNGFSIMGRLAKSLVEVINLGFEKTEHGSRRNHFFRANQELLRYVKTLPGYDPDFPAVAALCRALQDPRFEKSVYAARGVCNVCTEWAWDDRPAPAGVVFFSRDFEEGDTLTLATAVVYKLDNAPFERVSLYPKTLEQADIEALEAGDRFIINGETFPEIDIFANIPQQAKDIETVAVAIVTGQSGNSTSCFSLMPPPPSASGL